jgi:hypothetical protein
MASAEHLLRITGIDLQLLKGFVVSLVMHFVVIERVVIKYRQNYY